MTKLIDAFFCKFANTPRNSFPTPEGPQCMFVTQTCGFVWWREMLADCCEYLAEHVSALCGQVGKLHSGNAVGMYSYQCASDG
jgi:hypothetical protein